MHSLVLAAGFTDVKPGLIFWTLVTFFLVAIILRRVAWQPILKAVDEREKQITSSIDAAKKERAEAEKLLTEQKTAIAAARQEAADMMRKNQSEMDRFRDELMGKARKEAEELKVDARKTIEEERVKAVAELKAQSVSLAIQIAEKLLELELDQGKQKALAEKFIAELQKEAASQPRA